MKSISRESGALSSDSKKVYIKPGASNCVCNDYFN